MGVRGQVVAVDLVGAGVSSPVPIPVPWSRGLLVRLGYWGDL